eukprot:CAMPEP_0177417624 /NCGR_PEP_ID=MMETSP0368-20130122/68758_1 /TAXON_ID=447022 ORGANISM="Scrippsiella hangoei-like, Strain SHHI-4" /NCGR_SAMPLE_ID=MMETSP0368 /ASSEMBLY_ACC=CAM_ASM_000363 /LENGTH=50 /DNA_ID=CAMNT_0018887235 /DNA_START=110 /DNA_END=260 /DNA_ORIENTATION=-
MFDSRKSVEPLHVCGSEAAEGSAFLAFGVGMPENLSISWYTLIIAPMLPA